MEGLLRAKKMMHYANHHHQVAALINESRTLRVPFMEDNLSVRIALHQISLYQRGIDKRYPFRMLREHTRKPTESAANISSHIEVFSLKKPS
jgi:predicted nucleic acid-binding OB-fold protein